MLRDLKPPDPGGNWLITHSPGFEASGKGQIPVDKVRGFTVPAPGFDDPGAGTGRDKHRLYRARASAFSGANPPFFPPFSRPFSVAELVEIAWYST